MTAPELQLAEVADEPHLTPIELAQRWKVHPVTLANWRVQGRGPKYVKVGRSIRYPMSRVEAFEQARTRSNTAVG